MPVISSRMSYGIALSTMPTAYLVCNNRQKTKRKTTKQSKNKKQIAKSNKEDTGRDTKRGKREKRKEGKKEKIKKNEKGDKKGRGGKLRRKAGTGAYRHA